MNAQPWAWQAHVFEATADWAMAAARVTLFRRDVEGGEQIVGFDEGGHPIIERVVLGAIPKQGFRIPREALQSLAEAIKPGPSQGEVKRLEEALAVERIRVDRMIQQDPTALHRVAPTDRGADVVALILSERAAEFVRSVLVAFEGPESGNKLAAEVVEAIDGRPRR